MKTTLLAIWGSILLGSGIIAAFATIFTKAVNENGMNAFLSSAMGVGGIALLIVAIECAGRKK